MRKLFLMFAVTITAVMCMSVSAFAVEVCTRCDNPAEDAICLPCGKIFNYCDCCIHLGGCDFYLNEDGSLHHLLCLDCGSETELEADPFLAFGLITARLPGYPETKIYRGDYLYAVCEHDFTTSDEVYLYVDKYGMLSAVCPECGVFIPVSYLLEISTPIDLDVLHFLAEEGYSDLFNALDALGWRIDSYSGFITTRCNCGWVDLDSWNITEGLVRYNGNHEAICDDCGQVYTGIFGLFQFDSYACTGEDCDLCSINHIESDYVPPVNSTAILPDVVSSGSFDGVLGEVCSLVVIAVPVLAGCFGVRKGVVWLLARIGST